MLSAKHGRSITWRLLLLQVCTTTLAWEVDITVGNESKVSLTTSEGAEVFILVRLIRQMSTSSTDHLLLSGSCSELIFVQAAVSRGDNDKSFRRLMVQLNDSTCSLAISSNSMVPDNLCTNGLHLMPPIPLHTCDFTFNTGEHYSKKILRDLSSSLRWERYCVLYTEEYELCTDVISAGLWDRTQHFISTLIEPHDRHALWQRLQDCIHFSRQNFKDLMIMADHDTLRSIFAEFHNLSTEYQGLGDTARVFIFTQTIPEDTLIDEIPDNLRNVAFFPTVNPTDRNDNTSYSVRTLVKEDSIRELKTAILWDRAYQMYRYDDVFPTARYILNHIHFRVTTKEWEPFTVKTVTNGEVTYSGLCVDLLDELASRLNFSYTMEEPADGQWGALKNGSWTGMIGQLVDKEVDVMIGAVSAQKEREDVMDFTYPFFHDSSSMILKKSLSIHDVWTKIFRPFHWTALLMLAGCVLVIGLVLSLMEAYHPMYRGPQKSHFRNWNTCMWYLLAALLREGGEVSTRSQSGRTVIATWWLFTIVIMAMYTGDLIGSFAITTSNVPFNTLAGLVKQTTYIWGVEEGAYIKMMLPLSTNEAYKAVWRGIQQFERDDPSLVSTNITYHLERVNQGNYVFLNDRSMLTLHAEKDCEHLVVLKESFLTLQFAIGLHQHSTYREMFSEQILFYQEVGLLSALGRKWWPKNVTCDRKAQKTETQPIGLHHMQGVYIFGSIIITLGGVMLVCENITYRLVNRRIPSHT